MSREYYRSVEERAKHAVGWRDSEGEAFRDAVSELSAEIDRLEDLRRWRPMEELPVDDRPVLGRERPRAGTLRSVDSGTFTVYHTGDEWRIGLAGPVAPRWEFIEWAYIPGQEPAEVTPDGPALGSRWRLRRPLPEDGFFLRIDVSEIWQVIASSTSVVQLSRGSLSTHWARETFFRDWQEVGL